MLSAKIEKIFIPHIIERFFSHNSASNNSSCGNFEPSLAIDQLKNKDIFHLWLGFPKTTKGKFYNLVAQIKSPFFSYFALKNLTL